MSGWEPTQSLTYLYQRTWWKPWTWFPVGARITSESEWSMYDVDILIASRDYEASIGSHGHPLDEATSPEANPANSDGAFYYVTDPRPALDHAERARVLAVERWRKTLPEGESTAGYFFPVRKVWRTPPN